MRLCKYIDMWKNDLLTIDQNELEIGYPDMSRTFRIIEDSAAFSKVIKSLALQNPLAFKAYKMFENLPAFSLPRTRLFNFEEDPKEACKRFLTLKKSYGRSGPSLLSRLINALFKR